MSEVFKLEIRTDNAAFDDAPASEIARILRSVAGQIDRGDMPGPEDASRPARDINGNLVGWWRIESTGDARR